jgi:membrane-associated phospholipid phosphatase
MTPKRRTAVRAGTFALILVVMAVHSLPAAAAPGSPGQAAADAAGRPAKGGDPLTLKQAGKYFLNDAGRIWSSPARIKNKHVAPLIVLAAATTFLITADEPIRDEVQSYAEKHRWVGDVSPVITQFGGRIGFATAGVFFGAGLIFKDGRARDTGYMAASAILQSFLVSNFLKAVTGRQRPFVADGVDHWSGPARILKRFGGGDGDHYASFPSGHSATAFSLATVVALQYRHHGWVPVVAYSLAAGVGLSRMTLDKHWASDVLVGAVVGHLVARLVVRDHERRRRIVPLLACTGRGIALSVFCDLDPDGP